MSLRSKELIKTVVFFVCLTLGLFLLKQFIFTPVVVRGHSIGPTLANDKRVTALKDTEISRFDTTTFPTPDEPDKNYIKCVISLPGGTTAYKDDTLYINRKEVDKPCLDGSRKTLTDSQPLTGDFSLKERVSADSCFVLGGNRRNSKDGRVVGFIHKKGILGEVKFVIWPFSRFGPIPEVPRQ